MTFTGSICQPSGVTDPGDCEFTDEQTLTAAGWIDYCRSEGKDLCANYHSYTYECEAPVPDPPPEPPTSLPQPNVPGQALVLMPQPDPFTMCVSGLSLDL